MKNDIKCFFGFHSWKWKALKLNNTLDLTMPKWARCENCWTCLDKKLTGKTKVFCDCNNELTSTNSFVSDNETVNYTCSYCGEKSTWDFDCITPIRIK